MRDGRGFGRFLSRVAKRLFFGKTRFFARFGGGFFFRFLGGVFGGGGLVLSRYVGGSPVVRF
ncbi:MAG: hypothetical protein J6X44_06865, partial [Thermoguttaceae bacterium]|nr:hypothetical protein [Thermoguttaceae bacterium]